MKYTKGAMLVAGFVLALLDFAPVAQAEVSVHTDRRGNYLMTQIIPGGSSWNPKVWSSRSSGKAGRSRTNSLNPRGDENGDRWPAVAEQPTAPYHPVVVWSRGNGSQYDLAWATWENRRWSPVRWVFPEGDALRVDDLDVSIDIDDSGLPMIVWWRDVDGVGQVFLSMHYADRWMEPFAITDSVVDSRYPAIRIDPEGMIEVTYETEEGLVSQLVAFTRPVTITDDINPQNHFSPQGLPVLIKRNPYY